MNKAWRRLPGVVKVWVFLTGLLLALVGTYLVLFQWEERPWAKPVAPAARSVAIAADFATMDSPSNGGMRVIRLTVGALTGFEESVTFFDWKLESNQSNWWYVMSDFAPPSSGGDLYISVTLEKDGKEQTISFSGVKVEITPAK